MFDAGLFSLSGFIQLWTVGLSKAEFFLSSPRCLTLTQAKQSGSVKEIRSRG